MPFLSPSADNGREGVTRPIVQALFVSSCLLSVVSWYTTQQGMALYLSPWFSVLASLGVQVALVLVAWLIGFTDGRRAMLIAVYAATALISIGFSYVSLYTWFSAKERPATIQRSLHDALTDAASKTEELLLAAQVEAQKHVLALDEMTQAEKTVGHISRAADADPYLDAVRQAVAREARSYEAGYREGAGTGVRYTAFDRYAKIARQSLERIQQSARNFAAWRTATRQLDPADKQFRSFRDAYESTPWAEIEETLHRGKIDRPAVPAESAFVDQTVSGQEDLLVAFQELFTAPTGRHAFAFSLAAFIDIIVFLLAFASGPYLFGAAEQRWIAAAAAVDRKDPQLFARDFLSKIMPAGEGLSAALSSGLTAGERQFCLLLCGKGLCSQQEREADTLFVIDASLHAKLLESISMSGIPLRASASRAAAG